MATKRQVASCMVLSTAFVLIGTLLFLIKTGQDVPNIYIANEMIDLGIIDGLNPDPNRPKRVRFRIENRGTGVLKLTRVHTGCRCLEPRLDREILLPGETATLSVRVVMPNSVGEFREKIWLFSNDEKHPVKKLLVKGFVHRPCYVLPEFVTISGLRPGEKRRVELEVTGPVGDKSFVIREVSARNDEVRIFKVEKIGIMTKSSRPVWRVVLTVASCGVDVWDDTILVSTSGQESQLLEVPVKVRELPPIRADPPIVIFRRRADNKAPTAKIQITSNISRPVETVDIEKPDWIDLHIETNVNSLLAKLHLTMREVPDKIKFGTQEGIVLKLGEGFNEVRIPILVLPGPAATISQGQDGIDEG